MCPQGVYPAGDALQIGDQISSTYEGRHITLYADNLSHSNALAVVTKGYPVWWSNAVGVAFETQVAGQNPLIAVDTEGIWVQDVFAQNDAGGSNVIPGDALYINTTTGLISKITNEATQLPFGYALGNVTSGNTDRIAVKVHWDPLTPAVINGAKLFNSAVTVTGSLNALEHFAVAYDATIGRDLSVLQHFSVAYNAIVGNDLTVRGHGNVAYNLIVGNDLTVVGHAGCARVHAGNGANFNGAITNLTVEDGIVTAAS